MADANITAEYLRELLHYDPTTGLFKWRDCGGPRQRLAGTYTGVANDQGYVRIQIDGKRHHAHRLAWLYVNGKWPDASIDHIDGVRDNNRISNLREASVVENARNRYNLDSRNKHGLAGISRSGKKWMAQIRITVGKLTYLGSYPSPEAAHEAYLTAKRAHHPTSNL